MAGTSLTNDGARQQLHEIVRKDAPFNKKAREALALGKQYLGVDNGHLTRIDLETDHWEIVVTTDTADGQAPPGLELELQETYCRETIEDDTPLALHDAPNQGWGDDPAFETTGYHTYLAIPLITENEPYGTVCFAAQDPRSNSFSEAETQFADHLTRLLERELEKELIEGKLTNQTNLSTVLHRILRHNLRNDISVIRGYTELMADQVDDDSVGETVLNHIDGLIDLSKKARELEEVVTTNSERQVTEIGTLIEEIAAEITQEDTAASITVEYDNEIQGKVLQNFDQAIEELIENAVKHSGDNPSVTVGIETVPNGIEIQIKDNGPGLPDHEAEVLSAGVETPLAHGSGLGLWLAYWIVSSHDGSIDPEITEHGTTMTVTIPRKPDITVQQQVTELTRSRDKYKTSFEEASDAITIVNDDGRIVDANEAASTIFGAEDNELLGRSLTEFFPDEFAFDTEWQDFQEGGGQRDTVTIIGADGVEKSIEYEGTSDIIPDQHLFISRDITERREREEEIRELNQQLEGILDTAEAAIFLKDSEGQYLQTNQYFRDMFGIENIEDVIGMTDSDLFSEDVAAQYQADDERVIENNELIETEEEVPTNDGTRTYLTRKAPISDEDGNTYALVAVATDITERRERERELEVAETVFQNAQDALVLVDVVGEQEYRLNRVNEAFEALTPYDRADITGMTPREMLGDEVGGDVQPRFNECVAGQETIEFEQVVPGEEGSRIWQVRVTPLIQDGEVTQLVLVMRNITERKEREQELSMVRERYETLLEAAPDPVFVADAETGELIEVNEASETLLGMSSDEIIGMHQSELLPSEQAEQYRQLFEEIVESGGSKRRLPDGSHVTIVTANGERVPVDISVGTVSLPDGQVIYGIFRDVSEQIEREQELEATTQRLQLALEGTDTGVWDWTIETDNVRWTESLERLFGLEPGTFEGTLDAFKEYIHPDDREEATAAVERAVETESRFQTEFRIQREDGSLIWIESRGEVYDDGDDTKRMVGIATDISERKDREAELTQKTEAIEKAPVGIVLSDPDQSDNPLVYVNERFCELTGYDESEILGRNCRFMQGPETDSEPVAEMRNAIDNEEPVTTVLRNYRSDGQTFWNRVTIAPIRNEDGAVSNWVGFQEDATERIERKQQLELAETVFENTQDALFVIDVTENGEFYIERVNEVYEELTGLSNDQIAGKTPTEAVGEEIGSEIESQYRECVERQETIKYPEEIPVDGEQRQWETKVTPVISEGRVDKLIGATRGVTSV